jgi:hypothetical protein
LVLTRADCVEVVTGIRSEGPVSFHLYHKPLPGVARLSWLYSLAGFVEHLLDIFVD